MDEIFSARSVNVNGARPTAIDPNDNLVHFCQLAALVVTFYDHFLTLDDEVEYIWKKRWSKSKALFLAARYFGDFLMISICVVFLNRDASHTFCAVGLKFVGTGSMVIIIITQMIMQLRVKALYNSTVSWLISVVWVLEVTAVISLGVASLAAIDVHPVVLNTVRMCNPTYLPRYAFLFWVPVIVFESLLFSLALRIAYKNYLEIGDWRGASLLYIILRDNFSFFVLAFASYIITATTWLTANPRYFTVPGAFSCSLTAIMGCRLIINLCTAYHRPPDPHSQRPGSIWAAASSGNGIRFLSRRTTKITTTTSVAYHWPPPPRGHQPQTWTLPGQQKTNISTPLSLGESSRSGKSGGTSATTSRKTETEELIEYELQSRTTKERLDTEV